MWVRGAAIRPVPSYAIIEAHILEQVEDDLASDDARAEADLDRAFARFEATQPFLSQQVSEVLGRQLDETALALGYFLSISVWLSFELAFNDRLDAVTPERARAADDALTLEEELRAQHGEEPLDLDDVMAIEQPAILAFVNNHIDAALDKAARAEIGQTADVDVDDVHVVYRMILFLTLALSHAVRPVGGAAKGPELLA